MEDRVQDFVAVRLIHCKGLTDRIFVEWEISTDDSVMI